MSWENLYDTLLNILYTQTGLFSLNYKLAIMWGIGLFFVYLAVAKKYEPLLLLPIGFGIFLVNFPLTPLMGVDENGKRELLNILFHYGVEWEVIPCLIFLGLGAMTDFGPFIANPKTLIIGAGAQLGVFVTFLGVLAFGFSLKEAASVGIICGADGPTTIYLTAKVAPHLLGANALAAYTYMAMVPVTASHHESAYDITRTQDGYETAPSCLKAGEAHLSPARHIRDSASDTSGRASDGDVYARQFYEGKRCGGQALKIGAGFFDEHHNHFSWRFSRRHYAGGKIPDRKTPLDLRLRHYRVCHFHYGRNPDGQVHESFLEKQNEPPYRIGRCLCGPNGGACLPGRGPEGESIEFSPDACYWSESGRRHRNCRGSRYADSDV